MNISGCDEVTQGVMATPLLHYLVTMANPDPMNNFKFVKQFNVMSSVNSKMMQIPTRK